MSAKNDGGPAFPKTSGAASGDHRHFPGMSLRDYFAATALQGLLAASQGCGLPATRETVRGFAITALEFADAMLAERDKP